MINTDDTTLLKTFIRKTIKLVLILFIINTAAAQQSDVIAVDKVMTTNKSLDDFTVQTVDEIQGISIMNFTGDYNRNINNSVNIEARQAVFQEFYQQQPDKYDLVYIFTEFPFDTAGANAFAIPLMNDVEGIGRIQFDNRAAFFSQKLQTSIDMSHVDNWSFNPVNIGYDQLLDTMMHEFMHRYGIYVKYIDENGQISDKLLGRDSIHWSYFFNSDASVMYGSLWQQTGVNSFKTTNIRQGLSMLDLYLAGFEPKESVTEIFVINNADMGLNTDLPPPISTEIMGEKELILIDDIIAHEGPRIPDYTAAQHQFNVKFILLKRNDQEINQQTIAKLFTLQKEFQKRFFAETNGKGQIILPTDLNDSQSTSAQGLVFNPSLNDNFNLQAALDFILQHQVNNSYWFDRDQTRVRDTVVSIKALQRVVNEFPQVQTVLNEAILWINNYSPENNDEIAWMLASGVLNNSKQQTLLDSALNSENESSGWGIYPQSKTSPYDTVLMLDALYQLSIEFDSSTQARQYVLDHISEDSGYSYTSDGENSLVSSTILLKNINKISDNSQDANDLVNLILSKKLANNTYGENIDLASVHETASVIKVLQGLNDSNYQLEIDLAKTALNKMQSVDGSMQGSIYSTALAISVFNNNNKVELSFANITVSNDNVIAGEQIAIKYQLLNSGLLDASNIKVTIFRDNIDVNNQLAQTVLPLLAANQRVNQQITIDTTGFSPDTNLIAVIDFDNTIVENNESNNSHTFLLTVNQANSEIELAFDTESIDISPSQFSGLPVIINANAKITNLSLSDQNDVIVSLIQIITDGSESILATQSLNITSQTSQQYNLNGIINQVNNDIQLRLQIDPENNIIERNEDNNSYEKTIEKIQSIDIEITAQDVSVPSQLVIGDSAEINFNFRNIGTEISSSFSVDAYAEINGQRQLILNSSIVELNAGEQLTRQINWQPTAQGNYSIIIIIDEVQLLAETNEDNNLVSIPVQVVANSLTNITIEQDDISLTPNPGLQGQNLQFLLNIHNDSDIDSGSFDINIYQQTPSGIPNILIASLVGASSISANSTSLINLDLVSTSLQGVHTYIFSIDSSNAIAETNENDNTVFKDFQVLTKADAHISLGGIQLTPSIPVLGESLTVSLSVNNIGEQELSNLSVSLYYDDSSTNNPVLIESQNITQITGGQTQTVQIDFTYPNDSSIDTLTVKLDEQNLIDEGKENNNQASIQVGTQAQSLYVTQRYFSPNGDGIKDETSIVFNTGIISDYQIKISNDEFSQVRLFAPITFQNSQFGDVSWDGKNDSGIIARDGEYNIDLLDQMGTVVESVTVTLDTNRTSLFESMFNNNIYHTDLNCLADFSNSTFQYASDGKSLFTRSYKTLAGEIKKGLFQLKTDGSKISRILSTGFLGVSEAQTLKFVTLSNGYLLLAFEKDNLQNIYLFDPVSNAIELLYQGSFSNRIIAYTEGFVVIESGDKQWSKVYYDTSILTEDIQFQKFTSVVQQLENGLIISFRNFDSSDLYFLSFDFNQNPVLIETGVEENKATAFKNISPDRKNFSYWKDNILNIFKTENDALIPLFTQQINSSKNFGYSSHNQLFVLNDEQILSIYDNSANQVTQTLEPTFLIDGFDSLLAQIDSVRVDIGAEGLHTFALSEMFDSSISQEVIGYTDYTDRKEINLLIKNNFLGKFLTPECDDFIIPCYGWMEITEAVVVSQYIMVVFNYADLSHPKTVITPLSDEKFTELFKFPNLQEGRSNYIGAGSLSSSFWFDNNDSFAGFQNTNDTIIKTYPSIYQSGVQSFALPNHTKIENFSSALIANIDIVIESECASEIIKPKFISRSRKNLYAAIQVVNNQQAAEITISAFDEAFDRYELHWASAVTPNQWNFISASNLVVFNTKVQNWIPVTDGLYHIKVTTYDKAGNSYEDITTLTINNVSSSIRNISLTPQYFSPNGDGIKDIVIIEYEVTAAMDLLVEIRDESGLTVRTFIREYLNPVGQDQIQWDGKDQNGQLLNDGHYQVIVQGFLYDVFLDTKPFFPILELEINGGVGKLFDTIVNTKEGSEIIDTMRRNPQFKRRVTQFLNSQTNLWERVENSLQYKFNSENMVERLNTKYRMLTEDLAGNIAFPPFRFVPESYFIKYFMKNITPTDSNDPNTAVFSFIKEDPDFPRPQNIVYPMPDNPKTTEWIDWSIGDKVAYMIQAFTYTPADLEFITMQTQYKDPNTGEFITSEKKFIEPLTLADANAYFSEDNNLTFTNNENVGFLHDIAGQAVFVLELDRQDFPDTNALITLHIVLGDGINSSQRYVQTKVQFAQRSDSTPSLINLTFDPEEDFRNIGSGREHAQVAYDNIINSLPVNANFEYLWLYQENQGTIINEKFEVSEFIDDNISGSQTYLPDFVEQTNQYISKLYIIPRGSCLINREMIWGGVLELNQQDLRSNLVRSDNEFCLNARLEALFYMGEFCSNIANENTSIRFEMSTENAVPVGSNLPFLVELYRLVENQADELIFADTNPQFSINGEGNYNYTATTDFDTSILSTGIHAFTLIMHDNIGNTKTHTLKVAIDDRPTTNQVTRPFGNTLFCASDENTGEVIIEVDANIDTRSSYGVQAHIVVDGTSENSAIAYRTYNNVDVLDQTSSTAFAEAKRKLPFFNDQATLILETFNSTGVSFCSITSITIDALVDFELIENMSGSDVTILSPNADGIKDSVKLATIIAHEDLFIEVKLFDATSTTQELALLQSASLLNNETEEYNWDGTITGNPVPDGKYFVEFTLVDNCNLVRKFKYPITIDTTPPTSTFVTPLDGGSLNAIQRVIINTEELNLNTNDNISERINIEYFFNGVWNQLEILTLENISPELYEIQLDWNLTNLSAGIYPLQITVEDVAGNKASTLINPELLNSQDIFWNYSISPLFISPNTDSIQDNARIDFGLNLISVVSVKVFDSNQNLVRTLLDNQLFSAQGHQIIFNGMDNTGNTVADGEYTLTITASDNADLSHSATLSLSVVVDNTAPQIQWLSPLGEITKGEGTAQATVLELNILSVHISNQQLLPLQAANSIINSTQATTYDLFDLADLEETQYQLTAQAIDLAGNKSTSSLNYLIDKTAPVITLITPENDAFVGGLDAEIYINGTVNDNNFDHYELAIATVPADENTLPIWQTIHTDTLLTDFQFDYQWLIAVNDGAYLLRLSAYDKASWLTQTTANITVDTTVPEAQIDTPANQALIGKGTAIMGDATDANFDFYTLSYNNTIDGNLLWSVFNIGQSAISSDQLGVLPDDLTSGNYDIKLIVQDKTGLTSESIVSVVLDVLPPAVPLNLTAEVTNGNQVTLQWDNVTDTDHLGYILYRNGVALNTQLLPQSSYIDTALGDGQYLYWVVSVDTIGNTSEPSNNASISIDTIAPNVDIFNPTEDQRLKGSLSIIGTASSLLDFNQFSLTIREDTPNAVSSLIHQSPIAVSSAELGVLDTTVLTQDVFYIIELQASDNTGNVAVAQQRIFVDNNAPDAPLNLTHQLQGSNNVQLQWTNSNAVDLAGYLVFNNGVVISGSGNTNTGSSIPETNFLVQDLNDATHVFTVAAIDFTGNISGFSNSVQIIINSRVPDTFIITPVAALQFDTPILFSANSEDTDISQILFEYSTDNSSWITLDTSIQAPYQTTINPITLGLDYGELYLRATATDNSAQADPTPAQITIEYKDITAPASIQNLSANIDGGQISFDWDDNNEADIQGYIVSRTYFGQTTQLTPVAIVDSQYTDNNLADGDYSYHIQAQDNNDNQSTEQMINDLQVFSLQLQQPFSPLLTPATTQINGATIKQQGLITLVQQTSSGNTNLADITIQFDNTFISPSLTMQSGLNSFIFSHEVNPTHKSKATTVQVEFSPQPLQVDNLQVTTKGFVNSLSWDASADTYGYLVYRGGLPIESESELTTGITYSASSDSSTAQNVANPDTNQWWSPRFNDITSANETFIQAAFDQPRWIASIDLQWSVAPSSYKLQYSSAIGWIDIADFGDLAQQTGTTQTPYLTDKIRILFTTPVGVFEDVRLELIQIAHQALVLQNNLDITEIDGTYQYQLSAVNVYGFESTLSDSVEASVGDTTAPDTVVLSAEVQGLNDVSLTWSASGSVDVASYWLFRNNELILITADETILNYTDSGVANGHYDYFIRTVDMVNNTSPNSNTASVDISQQAMPVPQNLSIFAAIAGNSLVLDWDEVQSSRLHHYDIKRSQDSAGPFEKIAQALNNHYQDHELFNGTRYYYVVVAVEEFDNASANSNLVSAIPQDNTAPLIPVITSPTVSGSPITFDSVMTDISGIAEPNNLVDLYVNDQYKRTTRASETAEIKIQQVPDFLSDLKFSKGGDWFAYNDFSGKLITQNIKNGNQNSINISFDEYTRNSTATKLYITVFDFFNGNSQLVTYDNKFLQTETLFSSDQIISAVPSPAEDLIFYRGSYTDPQTHNREFGIWIYNLATSSATNIPVTSSSVFTNNKRVAWSNDGESVAFINTANTGELYVYHVLSQILTLVDTDFNSQSTVQWSADDSTLLYNKASLSQQLYNYDIASAQITAIVLNTDNPKRAYYSPDGSQFVYQQECCSVMTYDISSQSTELFYTSDTTIQQLIWNTDNGIEIYSGQQVLNFTNPGDFTFNDVILNSGQNIIHTIARDDSNNQSDDSLTISIERLTNDLPDLEINASDIIISPASALQGNDFIASFDVYNRGDLPVIDVDVQAQIILPNNTVQNIEITNINIAAGNSQSLFLDLGQQDMIGQHRLQIAVDASNQITEISENNNNAIKTFKVLENLDPTLQMFITPEQLAPEQDANINISVFNPAQPFDGTVILEISDQAGFPVGNQQNFAITDLANNNSQSIDYNWQTTGLFSGIYHISTTLIASNGDEIVQQQNDIEIQAFAQFQITLDTANSNIQENESIQFNAGINYIAGNTAQDAVINWQIVNNNQQTVFSSQTNLNQMLEGFNTTVVKQWQTQIPGDYQLQLQFIADNDQQSLNLPFTVVAQEAELVLQGDISTTPNNILLGNNLIIDYQLSNMGDIDLNNTPIIIQLLSTDLNTVIASHTSSISLLSGESTSLNSLLNVNALQGNQSYLLALYADTTAQGGNQQLLLDTRSITAIDTIAPQITINSPAQNSLNPTNIDVNFSVTEQHGQLQQLQIQSADINQGTVTGININNLNDAYLYQMFNLSQGQHQLVITATDDSGNNAQQVLSFNVDPNAPTIEITGVEAGAFYNHAVTAVISITDENLENSEILLNTVSFPDNFQISEEGNYFLSVTAQDTVNNRSSKSINFTVDLTIPVIAITFPDNNTQTVQQNTDVTGNTEANSEISLTTTNYQASTTSDTNGNFNFADVPLQLGNNNIVLIATDQAANISSQTTIVVTVIEQLDILSTLNNPAQAPVEQPLQIDYQINNQANNTVTALDSRVQLYNNDGSILIDTQVNSSNIDATQTINASVVFDNTALTPESYQLILSVFINNQWQQQDTSFIQLIDTTAPNIIVNTPEQNAVSNSKLSSIISVNDQFSAINLVSYQLDNSGNYISMVDIGVGNYSANLVLANGTHSINYRATDVAGNTQTSANVIFAVDTIAPVISINSPTNGQISNQTIILDYEISDDHQYTANALVNGVAINLNDDISDEGQYNLSITATDEVNNQSQQSIQFIIDKTTPDINIIDLQQDQQITVNDININGLTEPLARIDLQLGSTQLQTIANQLGEFSFTKVHLVEGGNQLQFMATDQAGNQSPLLTLNLIFSEGDICSIFGFKGAAPYNAFVFGNYQAKYSHVTGRLAAAHNIGINHYQIGQDLDQLTAGDALIAGNRINFLDGQVHFGNILAAGHAQIGQSVIDNLDPNAQIISNAVLPINFNDIQNNISLFSNALSQLAVNSSYNLNDNVLELTGNCEASRQVYNISDVEISTVKNMTLDCLADQAYVILNISGQQIQLDNLIMEGLNNIKQFVILNFYQAQQITIKSSRINASILAYQANVITDPELTPDSDIVFGTGFENSRINGQIIAASLNGNIQINSQPLVCTSSLTVDAAPIIVDQQLATPVNVTIFMDLTAVDESQQTLSYQMLTQPETGTFSGVLPNLSYTPEQDFIGTVSFDYLVTDQLGQSSQATISIEMTNNKTTTILRRRK